jgi:hypothetical protein
MSITVADGEIISSFRKFVETDVAVPVAAMNSLVRLLDSLLHIVVERENCIRSYMMSPLLYG